MIKVTLDNATLSKLHHIRQPVEIFDEEGRLIGIARPPRGQLPADFVEPPISAEELKRLENETEGRSLAEIRADLRK